MTDPTERTNDCSCDNALGKVVVLELLAQEVVMKKTVATVAI